MMSITFNVVAVGAPGDHPRLLKPRLTAGADPLVHFSNAKVSR